MSDPYYIQNGVGRLLPIIISCPHSGVEIPADVAPSMLQDMVHAVPDTDWYVHELYGFAPSMGITILHARYSRFVIDLNRDPQNQPLYSDGRHQTGLVPTTSFDKRRIYQSSEPDSKEVARRLEHYYRPYHDKLTQLVRQLKMSHSHVLVFEAHSIKRHVPTIHASRFPDMILGDQKGKTAAPDLTQAALKALSNSSYKVAHNEPFMGGYITRHFGKPTTGIHALQLEMSQEIYMDETNASRDQHKQQMVEIPLRSAMTHLAKALESLP